LLQVFSLYLPVLQCKELLELHRDLIKFLQKLQWQDEIHAIRYLRSRKGPFPCHPLFTFAQRAFLQTFK